MGNVMYKKLNLQKIVMLLLIFCFISFLSVIPAFYGGYIKFHYDGSVHISRFESVYMALKSKDLPPIINFIGFSGSLNAYNGMYPWLTTLIFVLPRFILGGNQLYALMAGFFILNFLTMFNTYLLVRELTNRIYIRLLGVFIYQLSTYHFVLMYSRNAIGEALAYAFIPLVFVGLYRIWNRKEKGFLFLGLGMGLIINSHILSAIMITTIILVILIGRILLKEITFEEIRQYFYAVVTAIAISSYMLVNFFTIYLFNKIETPFKGIQGINGGKLFEVLLNNVITDEAITFNIGLFETLLLFLLLVYAFISDRNIWKKWIVGAGFLYLITLDWFPWHTEILVNSPLGTIQFLGRLLTYVVLFLMIGVVLFFEHQKGIFFSNRKLILVTALLLSMGMCATYNYHVKKNDFFIWYFLKDNNDFNNVIYKKVIGSDYQLQTNADKDLPIEYVNVNKTVQKYDRITLLTDSPKKRKVKYLIPIYKGVNYTIIENGKNIANKVRKGKMLTISLRKGLNRIIIRSKASGIQWIAFLFSIVAIILATALSMRSLLLKHREIK